MRRTLGRIAALCFAGAALFVGMSSAIEVQAVAPTTTLPATTTTTTTTTTTLPAPPLVIDVPTPPAPALATPTRGPAFQATDTLPPPPTTTTLPPPPSDQLPADSGEGRRVVYSKSLMRVWTVESNGEVSKTHRVSGRRTYDQPLPGTYSVFSRSGFTCNIKNPEICWRFMVRFTIGPDGDNIGFHEIPKIDGVPVQSESQIGQALSNGCVRQATTDAIYMWDWAGIGTKVVVLG